LELFFEKKKEWGRTTELNDGDNQENPMMAFVASFLPFPFFRMREKTHYSDIRWTKNPLHFFLKGGLCNFIAHQPHISVNLCGKSFSKSTTTTTTTNRQKFWEKY